MSGLLLVVLNQHRLQPWHWLFLLCQTWSLVFAAPHSLQLMRHTLSSMYVCAALSRISLTPQNGMTGLIVSQLLKMSHVAAWTADKNALTILCCLATGAEFLTGVLLLFRRTRTAGAF